MNLNIPQEFKKMNSMPEDQKDSSAFEKQTASSNCFLMIYPIDNQKAMPYENEKAVVDGIHGALTDTQGLVEVKTGTTKNQKRYVYSIVKSKLEPSGVQYILTMHIDMQDYTINVQAFFNEKGITGGRDTAIMNKMINEEKIALPNLNGWLKDPYDENYKRGLLMNLSEQPQYDTLFPEHPLSEARRFIEYVVESN